MAEVRFTVDDKFLASLQKSLNTTKATDVVREALTVLNWAVNEKSQGKEILSGKLGGNSEPTDLVKLATPGLSNVSKAE